jgi:hypothetical protein
MWKNRILKLGRMVMIRMARSVLPAVFVVGCATYQAPAASDSHATLILKNPSSTFTTALNAHKNPETCEEFIPIVTGFGNSYAKNRLLQNSTVSVRIPADKPFGLYASSERAGATANDSFGCNVVATFTPKRDATYVGEFSYNPPRCALRMEELRNGQRVEVPVRYRRQMPTSITRPTPWCSG